MWVVLHWIYLELLKSKSPGICCCPIQRVISLYRLMQRHISEDLNLYQLCCVNLTFHITEVVVVYTSHLYTSHFGVFCTFIKPFKQSLQSSFLCACVHACCHWKWCTCFVASDQVRLVCIVVVCPRYLTHSMEHSPS